MKYQEIQDLKLFDRTKRINFKMPIAPLLYGESFGKILKNIIKGLFFAPQFSLTGSYQNAILISYNFDFEKRTDFYKIYSTTKTAAGQFNELKITRKFELKNLLKKIFRVVKNIKHKENLTNKYLSSLEVSCLEVYLERIPKLLDEFSQKLNPIMYISFCDSYMEENVIAQYFKQQKTPTITHQHGLYRQTNRLTNGTDSEAYLNFVSDYMLLWGDKTKKELINCGIDHKRLFVVGKIEPKEIISKDELPQHEKFFFIVFLNGDNNFYSNLNLLKIANEYSVLFNKRYVLKYHPTSKKKLYKKYLNNKFQGEVASLDRLHQYFFGLCHSSGIVIELLRNGLPTYILKDQFLDNFFDINECVFSNANELANKVKIHSINGEKSKAIFRKIGNSLIEYCNEQSIIQKTEVLLSTIKKQKL